MINPETINPLALPSVPLEQRSRLPTTPCIYFAIDSQGVIQYIGQSANPRQRWSLHHQWRSLKRLDEVRVCYINCDAEHLNEVELALIRRFSPLLNKQAVCLSKPSKGIRIRQVREVEIDGLGERIKQARLAIATAKSLEQICDEVGVSRTYWYDIEKETLKGALSIENLRKIEQVLGVDFGVELE